MIDNDNEFRNLIVNESNKYIKNNLNKPDTAYISSEWLVKVTANRTSSFVGYDKFYGLDLVYLGTYGLNDIVVNCRKKPQPKGTGSIIQIKDK